MPAKTRVGYGLGGPKQQKSENLQNHNTKLPVYEGRQLPKGYRYQLLSYLHL